jgi:hypothetical protein
VTGWQKNLFPFAIFRCLYLIGALAEITSCKSELSPLVPLIARAAKIKTYTEHYIILETICKILPGLAKSIGKKPFKEFLSILFEPIFCAIVCCFTWIFF